MPVLAQLLFALVLIHFLLALLACPRHVRLLLLRDDFI